MVKMMPSSRIRRTAWIARSVITLSCVTTVPSTSVSTAEMGPDSCRVVRSMLVLAFLANFCSILVACFKVK